MRKVIYFSFKQRPQVKKTFFFSGLCLLLRNGRYIRFKRISFTAIIYHMVDGRKQDNFFLRSHSMVMLSGTGWLLMLGGAGVLIWVLSAVLGWPLLLCLVIGLVVGYFLARILGFVQSAPSSGTRRP